MKQSTTTSTFATSGSALWHFFSIRKLSIAALASTLVMQFLSISQPAQQVEWLYKDNGIVIGHVQAVYALMAAFLVGVVVFEPQIRRELRVTHALGLLTVIGMVVSFLVVRIIKPDEAWRFFRSPTLVWFVITHAVLLCFLTVLLALDSPRAPVTTRLQRYAFLVVIIAGLLLGTLHVASVGQFMTLDLPDEMWLASVATNYAAKGDFYSSYLAGVFGNPDPFLPRYYMLMGLWLRLINSQTLEAIRAFSLFIAFGGVAVLAFLLRRAKLTALQQAAGIVIMIGLSAFVRASHNARMDAGLSLYGALLLVGIVGFQRDGRNRWLILLGALLLPGMELIPPLAVLLGVLVGGMLIFFAVTKRAGWRQVFLYGGICICSIVIYGAIHFLPDIANNVSNYFAYMTAYYDGRFGFDLLHLVRFAQVSMFLSPVEIVIVIGVIWLGWRGSVTRPFTVITVAALVLGMSIQSSSYGYLMVFTPFIAYLAAHVIRSRAVVVGGVFILLPALISAPLYDMMSAVEVQPNRLLLNEIELLNWRVPDGATVWAETEFWFTLREQVDFVGREGPENVARRHGISLIEAVRSLGVSVIICEDGDQTMCAVGDQLFGDPYVFQVTGRRFLMYSALGSV